MSAAGSAARHDGIIMQRFPPSAKLSGTAESFMRLFLNIVMVKNKSLLVPVAVNPAHASTEGGHEVIHGLEEDGGQDGAFQMSPQPLDQVQAGAVRQEGDIRQEGDMGRRGTFYFLGFFIVSDGCFRRAGGGHSRMA